MYQVYIDTVNLRKFSLALCKTQAYDFNSHEKYSCSCLIHVFDIKLLNKSFFRLLCVFACIKEHTGIIEI